MCPYWLLIGEILVVSALGLLNVNFYCTFWKNQTRYKFISHFVTISCSPTSSSSPSQRFSHTPASAPFPVRCSHKGSCLHQSVHPSASCFSFKSLWALSTPLLSSHPCLPLFWLSPIWFPLLFTLNELPSCSIKTSLLSPHYINFRGLSAIALHLPLHLYQKWIPPFLTEG